MAALDILVLKILLFCNRMEQASTINPDYIRTLRREEIRYRQELHIAEVARLGARGI